MKLELDDLEPAYYPPRRRWNSGIARSWARMTYSIGRIKVRLFSTHSIVEILLALMVPGVGCIIRRRNKTGLGIMAGWLALAFVFLAQIGHTESGLAFGFLIGIHVIGTTLWHRRRTVEGGSSLRGFGLVVMIALVGIVYLPLRNWIENKVVLPLNMNSHVFLVNPGTLPESIKRGDFVAYASPAITLPNHAMIREGVGLRPVLGMPGDTIIFGPASFTINGQMQPNQPAMPKVGSFTVPAGRWFVWPIYPPQMGVADQSGVMQALPDNWNTLVLVKQEQLMGRLYHRWFWKTQAAQ